MHELASGVDALYLSGRGALAPAFLDQLAGARRFADDVRLPVPFELGGRLLALRLHGFGKCRYCLDGEGLRIGVTPSTKLPCLRGPAPGRASPCLGPTRHPRGGRRAPRARLRGPRLVDLPPRPPRRRRRGRDRPSSPQGLRRRCARGRAHRLPRRRRRPARHRAARGHLPFRPPAPAPLRAALEAARPRTGGPAAEPRLLLTVEEAAGLLHLGRTRRYQLVMGGAIRSVEVGRRRLVVRAGLEEFVERLEAAQGAR